MSQILECRDLTKTFGDRTVVEQLSFQVATGEVYGLLGPNGAGKSTSISMICGLVKPSSGNVSIGGNALAGNLQEAQRLLGVVPQDIALYLTLTARENLMFWGRMYDLSGEELKRRVDESLEIVGLTDRAKDKVGTFSGGMKRRINIAAAILHRPKLLIMDEPTVGIDPQSRNNILEMVKRLNKENGMSVIYTSHYMEEVEYLCDRIGIIDHGKMIAEGSLSDIVQMIGDVSQIQLTVGGDLDHALTALQAVTPQVKQLETGKIVVGAPKPEALLPELVSAIAASNGSLTSIEILEPNLEACFLHLTGRTLRD